MTAGLFILLVVGSFVTGIAVTLYALYCGTRPLIDALQQQRQQTFSRNALYLCFVAVTLAGALGWMAGVVLNPRLNTTAIQAYVDARDFEQLAIRREAVAAVALQGQAMQAAAERTLQQAQVACVVRVTAEHALIQVEKDKQNALARGYLGQIAAEHALLIEEKTHENVMARDYSERILWLQQQLAVHGIAERIVPTRVTK